MRSVFRLSLFITLTSLLACSSDEHDGVSRTDCEKLRDHVVDLRMETVTADHDQHRAALRSSLGDFVTTCTDSTSPEQLRCSLAAADFASLAACTPGVAP